MSIKIKCSYDGNSNSVFFSISRRRFFSYHAAQQDARLIRGWVQYQESCK